MRRQRHHLYHILLIATYVLEIVGAPPRSPCLAYAPILQLLRVIAVNNSQLLPSLEHHPQEKGSSPAGKSCFSSCGWPTANDCLIKGVQRVTLLCVMIHTLELLMGAAEARTQLKIKSFLASCLSLSCFSHSFTDFHWKHTLHKPHTCDTPLKPLLLGTFF